MNKASLHGSGLVPGMTAQEVWWGLPCRRAFQHGMSEFEWSEKVEDGLEKSVISWVDKRQGENLKRNWRKNTNYLQGNNNRLIAFSTDVMEARRQMITLMCWKKIATSVEFILSKASFKNKGEIQGKSYKIMNVFVISCQRLSDNKWSFSGKGNDPGWKHADIAKNKEYWKDWISRWI